MSIYLCHPLIPYLEVIMEYGKICCLKWVIYLKVFFIIKGNSRYQSDSYNIYKMIFITYKVTLLKQIVRWSYTNTPIIVRRTYAIPTIIADQIFKFKAQKVKIVTAWETSYLVNMYIYIVHKLYMYMICSYLQIKPLSYHLPSSSHIHISVLVRLYKLFNLGVLYIDHIYIGYISVSSNYIY